MTVVRSSRSQANTESIADDRKVTRCRLNWFEVLDNTLERSGIGDAVVPLVAEAGWALAGSGARVRCMSEHPRPGILEEALRLPADERLALATKLLNSVEGSGDSKWGAAWLAELDRRAQETADDPTSLEDWPSVRTRLLGELRSK